MKTAFAILAAGAFLVLAGNNLSAAPVTPPGVAASSDIVLVAGGCGVGWHRGPFGGCRRNLSPRWPCWFWRGPYGHWHLRCH